jgi:hypothetical protein
MEHHRTHPLPVLLLICAVAAALGLASSAAAGQPGVETFTGACDMSGSIRHDPPLTQEPAPTEIHGRFSGTCTGELVDREGRTRQLDGAPARYEVRDAGGDLSCNGGTAHGTGSLLFGGGQTIEFTLTERRPGPGLAVVALKGASGGTATLFGNVSPKEDLLQAVERCSGSGLRLIHADGRIVSPGISG